MTKLTPLRQIDAAAILSMDRKPDRVTLVAQHDSTRVTFHYQPGISDADAIKQALTGLRSHVAVARLVAGTETFDDLINGLRCACRSSIRNAPQLQEALLERMSAIDLVTGDLVLRIPAAAVVAMTTASWAEERNEDVEATDVPRLVESVRTQLFRGRYDAESGERSYLDLVLGNAGMAFFNMSPRAFRKKPPATDGDPRVLSAGRAM